MLDWEIRQPYQSLARPRRLWEGSSLGEYFGQLYDIRMSAVLDLISPYVLGAVRVVSRFGSCAGPNGSRGSSVVLQLKISSIVLIFDNYNPVRLVPGPAETDFSRTFYERERWKRVEEGPIFQGSGSLRGCLYEQRPRIDGSLMKVPQV